MKKSIYILVAILFLACNSEDANDCFQTIGNKIQEEISVSDFERILVNRNVSVVLKEGLNTTVVVETGSNLINDVHVEVVGNQLQLTDDNICNFVREYAPTVVYITAPNIKEIRSSSQYDIISDGVLTYPSLKLFSEDDNYEGSFTVGDFRMHIQTTELRAVANNFSSFYISGNVEELFVGFYSGAGRFEGASLIAEHVNVYHRGSNDMIVNPQQSLTGELRGTGNLISVNQPPTVEVQQFYTGRLIFQ
ncbi:head GIN domain-containing protein [Corallibacter sp.]|uniref:head GIN domain-containing protein n=1 Tax=Corallibacter sp. TaxID=2038084 RepID=UPI003AB5B2A2